MKRSLGAAPDFFFCRKVKPCCCKCFARVEKVEVYNTQKIKQKLSGESWQMVFFFFNKKTYWRFFSASALELLLISFRKLHFSPKMYIFFLGII
jgi:hypothetical protein